ncbi:hypothetical protein O181_053838 [Austropuccinia psidii MF-1]|uniref:Uncharacterized protein n=1 Tax=Austropuccinia psidii MF-1 TaxID=1389203 RepID=A0A9Q3E857_9BASI|nr:hypothetical protein [Austropuccinia psidii MF-1]
MLYMQQHPVVTGLYYHRTLSFSPTELSIVRTVDPQLAFGEKPPTAFHVGFSTDPYSVISLLLRLIFFLIHVLESYIISTWLLVPQEIHLLKFLHFIAYITNQCTGPVPGQLIYLENKKNQENDYINPPSKEFAQYYFSEDSEIEADNYPPDSDESLR